MSDEDRIILQKGAGPENMVGMDMAHHHIFNRKLGCLGDRSAQAFAVSEAAAGIGDEHRLAPNDKAGVGDGIVVGERRIFVNAAPDVDA